ncbi:DUF4097 family beta strand repeat-containing protein [Streptomyces poonensis]|uniref:Lipoprotein n=1 Tax=Streptomyces poonensis TaxID=68255 RepID=A0A918PI71_9ACTN|nr:DUF4097 family beta strand repeat-containing protein [Streptomyces poonensis]GGZ11362.1 lipoprotein [Streptomyces poonensis]GLJ91580.1 lipoprotein [Streptomyces poonensis]
MARTVRARAVAVAGVVAVLMGSVAACGADASDDSAPEQRSFALQGRTLTVDSDDSALELVPADVDEVKVTRWFEGRVVLGGDPEVSWEMADDRLELRLRCSGLVADCAARHRIEVPRGVAVTVRDGDGSVTAKGFEEALNIRTGDGSVRVSDSSGPLEVRTGDGSVRVSDSSGSLEMHSGDGSVRAEGIEARSVRASTEDGSVRIELGVVPDVVEARSGDGSIDVGLPRDTYRVTTESADGSVDVSVPRDESSDHVVTARTQDGSVRVRTAN